MEVVNLRDEVEEKEEEQIHLKRQVVAAQQPPQQQTSNKNPPSSPPPSPTATASPPSASSSPTHEFSFTISLHPHPPPKSAQDHNQYYNFHKVNDNSTVNATTPQPPPPSSMAAIDLSPADDIFFHGHLLPLHLLSHLPVSPRSSTNSLDSFTLPIKDILNDQNNPIGNTSFHLHHQKNFPDFDTLSNNGSQKRPKSKSFSLFSLPKWKKGCHDEEDRERNQNSRKKLKLEVTQAIKRYMKMVRPLLSFPKAKRSNTEFDRQPYSFSGNLLSSRRSSRPPEIMKRGGGRRGDHQLSAPASMRTSPANSGILLASGTVSPTKSTTSDSTMEELQAAIQAAIAHCKNSNIAIGERIQHQK